MALPGPETLPTECSFEPPHLAPLSNPEPPNMTSTTELVKPEQGFVWQESSEFEADTAGSTVERHKKAQLDRLDINVQIDDSFVCTECGMEFSQIHHLKQHSLTHKGVKEFKCEVCGREFTLQANMKRHMLIHTSVRPYQCHICFKTFVQKQTLKTHMIVHSPVKPFKCKVCGKSFNRMYNLLGHMHLHAGSKPFKCPYCSSKFNLKGNLSRHMKVKHGVMDISLDSQDPMMELAGPDPSELDNHQEMEDFEENAYTYSSVDSSAEASTLTEQAMKEMAYYNVL